LSTFPISLNGIAKSGCASASCFDTPIVPQPQFMSFCGECLFVSASSHGTLKSIRKALVVTIAARCGRIAKTTGDSIGQISYSRCPQPPSAGQQAS